VFRQRFVVAEADIDELGHANNVSWVRWIQEVAVAHSAAVGWDIPAYRRAGVIWVVHRHEIDYLAPAFLGETLEACTWVESIERSRSVRRMDFFRAGEARALLRAATTWVLMGEKGRPCAIPAELRAAFVVLPEGPEASPASS